jgi:hypothetical protein
MKSCFFLLPVVFGLAGTAFGGQPASKGDPSRPIPAEIIDAWYAAGIRYVPPSDAKPGSLPFFGIDLWFGEDVFAKLPVPEGPFGLFIGDGRYAGYSHSGKGLRKDGGLTGLARLTSLQALNLWDVPITEANMRELAGLTKLQSLNLAYTPLTDAGLKPLAGLKELRKLDLRRTKYILTASSG